MSELGTLIGQAINLAWDIAKYATYGILIFAFCMTSQCQKVVNDVCEVILICKPNYDRVEWLESEGKRGNPNCMN